MSWRKHVPFTIVCEQGCGRKLSDVLISVAVRRYAQGAAQLVMHDLLFDLQSGHELVHKIRKEIGIFGGDASEKCLKFLEPCEEIRRERRRLETRQDFLREILGELDSAKERVFYMGTDDDHDAVRVSR